jgi:hypothetical protein
MEYQFWLVSSHLFNYLENRMTYEKRGRNSMCFILLYNFCSNIFRSRKELAMYAQILRP